MFHLKGKRFGVPLIQRYGVLNLTLPKSCKLPSELPSYSFFSALALTAREGVPPLSVNVSSNTSQCGHHSQSPSQCPS